MSCVRSLLGVVVALTFHPAWADVGDAQITILQTTDLHHHANGADHVGLDVDPQTGRGSVGSYARIAAYVHYVRTNSDHPVLLVDSGDWTMGTFYDLTLGTRPLALKFITLMRYDCVTLGNHEFDYTPKGLAQILSAAQTRFRFDTPIVASNMNLGGNADLAPFFGDQGLIRATHVQTLRNGLKVGYIGLMGKGAALDAPASAPVSFAYPSTHYATIQALVDGLRNSQGVQVVIALSHSGTDATGTSGEDVELAKHVSGIDVIASGHTHTPLASARAVPNGSWTTQIIDAGAYGTNVARIDLAYHASSQTTTLDASSNVAMTEAGLRTVDPLLGPDWLFGSIVRLTDVELNRQLGPFFSQVFPDYNAAKTASGIYHAVGTAAQDMVSNARSPVPAPNGLGDLAADALRSVPNAIIAKTLAAVGGNPANLPAYDFTPFQAGVVATGVLRGSLRSGVPLSFADVYNVLPLGISPDTTQALPVGYPLISAYLDVADVRKMCALQLVVQSNLAAAQYYLNLSGIQCGFKSAESYTYFKYATAAAVLQVTNSKATAGSSAAFQTLAALATLASDHGAALLAAYAAGNPYATAMVKLNDATPTNAQIPANLGALGQVAGAAAADSAIGTSSLSALIVSKAVAAVDTVSGFAANDVANLGAVAVLPESQRVRVVADLYAVLLLGAIQSQFGVAITPYKSVNGPVALSTADFPSILGNRVNAAPATAGVTELKEWMSLLSYQLAGLKGAISSDYASTSNFAQFGNFGAAVKARNASYPVASIAQLVSTLSSLIGAP